MDLKRLGHLVALADECHFARAAERVHLSQPAFSRSIQALEDELGMRMFDREGGEVRPTPAGRFMIERARRLLFDARTLQREASLYRDNQLGDTAFGAGPFPAATLMPAVVLRLRKRYPSVGLRLEMNNWQLLHERLLAEDLEFYVADVRTIPADPRIDVSPLARLAAHLYVRAAHPLARAGGRCAFAQAWACGMGSTRLPKPMQELVARLAGLPEGSAPVLAIECDSMQVLRMVALSSDTVIVAPESAVREEVAEGALVLLEVTDLPDVYADMGIVTLAGRTPSPMARRAIECLREVAGEEASAVVAPP